MSRLTSCDQPGKRRLSTTKARPTALAGTYPNVDLVSPADGPQGNHFVGTSIEKDKVALGLRKHNIMALHTNSVYAQQCFVNLINHLKGDCKAYVVGLIPFISQSFSPRFLATPPSATSYPVPTLLEDRISASRHTLCGITVSEAPEATISVIFSQPPLLIALSCGFRSRSTFTQTTPGWRWSQ